MSKKKLSGLDEAIPPILPDGWEDEDFLAEDKLPDEQGTLVGHASRSMRSVPDEQGTLVGHASRSMRSVPDEGQAKEDLSAPSGHLPVQGRREDGGAAAPETGARQSSLFGTDSMSQVPYPPRGLPDEGSLLVWEVRQLRALYPDVREMPEEVALAAARGVPLVQAYQAYRQEQLQRRIEALEEENRILRQNADNAARAVVRGAGGVRVGEARQSDFEKGFEQGLSWR